MSYNGSGTFSINSAGQPVVTGTVISSTAFNALTADLATGLSTAITKDGQTTTTARILFAQGISSTLVTDATSATTGSIITAGGISTQKALWVGTTSRLVGNVQADANVGIGMTPSNVLDITQNQNAATIFKMLNTGASTACSIQHNMTAGTATGGIAMLGSGFSTTGLLRQGGFYLQGGGAGGVTIATEAAQPIYFGINNNEVARIDTNGDLLIGTTTSSTVGYGASIVGIARIAAKSSTNFLIQAGQVLFLSANGGASGQGIYPSGDNYYDLGYTGYRWSAVYAVNGTIQTSDARLKTVLDKQRDFKSIIKNIWVGDVINHSREDKLDMVFLAQQLNEHMPDNVITPKEEEGDWGVNYAGYVPLAMWGVKDLYAENEALKARLTALENK